MIVLLLALDLVALGVIISSEIQADDETRV
jgi:hypothetical protein